MKGGAPLPVPAPPAPAGLILRRAMHAHTWVAMDGALLAPTLWVNSGPARVTSGYGSTSVPVVREGTLKFDPDSESVTATVNRPQRAALSRCAIPRAAAVTRPGHFVVACDGNNALVEFALDADRPRATQGIELDSGVTGMAYDAEKDRVLTWSQFDRKLRVTAFRDPDPIETRPNWSRAETQAFEIGSPTEDAFARGRRIFHEASERISRDGRSCISCHPGGRQDGMVWSGPTGPRQTPMLLGRFQDLESQPFGWNGGAESLRVHLTETLRRLGGTGLEDEDAEALIAYFTSDRGPSQPDDEDSSVARGEALFHSSETGCADCHRASRGFLDGLSYPILTEAPVDTPSLRFVGGTAPYMHDGRFETLEDVLAETDGEMGHTGHLSSQDRDALVAYLHTL